MSRRTSFVDDEDEDDNDNNRNNERSLITDGFDMLGKAPKAQMSCSMLSTINNKSARNDDLVIFVLVYRRLFSSEQQRITVSRRSAD
jgi:hypothetical protein